MSTAMCPHILPVNTKDIGRNSLISVSKPITKKGGGGGGKGGGGLSPPPNTLNRARKSFTIRVVCGDVDFLAETPLF